MPKQPRDPYENKPAQRSPQPPPTRADDLDHPYPLFDAIKINDLPGEEHYAAGLGIRQVVPYTKWGFEQWYDPEVLDSYALYFNNSTTSAAQDNVLVIQPRYHLTVQTENVPEGDLIVEGRVKRVSGNESWSPPRTFLVKRTRPGGIDTDPGDEYHSGLRIKTVIGFPEGSELTPENIGDGLTVELERWPNLCRNDKIDYSYNGAILSRLVTNDEAQGTGPIIMKVPRSTILEGPLSGDILMRFTVTDVVKNPAADRFPYSKGYMLSSGLDPHRLARPFFLRNNVATTSVNWDNDNDAVFKVRAIISEVNPTPVPPRRVHVLLRATLADHTTKEFWLPPATDTNEGVVYVDVDNAIIGQIVGGQFTVSFEWRKADDTVVNRSASRTVVVGGMPISMPAPTITPNELGQVDPSKNALFGLPVYDPHNPGWWETAYLENLLPGGGTIEWEEELLAGGQGGTRTIPAEQLQRFAGRGDTYAYYTTRDGATGQVRRSRKLTIQVGARTADMPPAELEGRIGNNVDPADVAGDPKVTLPYTGTRDRDVVFWSINGSALGGSDSGSFTIDAGSAGRALVFTSDRKILELNKTLSITYSLLRPGPPEVRLFSIPLDLTVGRAIQLDRPFIEHASQYPDELNPRAALNGTRVIVKVRPMPAVPIKVSWHSANGFGSVDEFVQGNPATNEVSVPINAHTIARGLTKDSQIIQVQYSFSRDGIPFESEIVYLRLLPLTGLPAPKIDGFDGAVLALAQLNPAARTRISQWALSFPGQYKWLRYSGTDAYGSSYIHDTYNAELVSTEEVANGIDATTPYAGISSLKDGSNLKISFMVSFAESPGEETAIRFSERNYTIQSLPSTLPAPKFANLTGPTVTINPLDYLNYAFFVVEYPGMNSTHWIEPYWLYPDGTKANIPGKYGLDGGRVDFPVSREVMTKSLGKDITLGFTATINGKPSPSYTQTLIVKALTAGQLPPPLINGTSPGGILDLRTSTGNPLASVAHWPYALKDQKVWITCTSDGVNPLHVLSNYSVTAQEASNGLVNKVVLRDWLDLLKEDKIKVTCEVAFDPLENPLTKTLFPVVEYTVLNKWMKDDTPFTGNFMNGWVSYWPNDSIQRESNGNYFFRGTPLTGQGVRIEKTFTPNIAAYYLVTFNFRINKEAAIGGPTTIELRLGSLVFTKQMFEIEKWESFSIATGFVPSDVFKAQIRVNNPTTGGLYDFDNIRILQRPVPA